MTTSPQAASADLKPPLMPILLLVFGAMALLVLAGCSSEGAPESDGKIPHNHNTFLVNTESNGTVECVYANHLDYSGGLSCNWK